MSEKVIQDYREHTPTNGFRKYKRISERQASASKILTGKESGELVVAKPVSVWGNVSHPVSVQNNMQKKTYCPVYQQQLPLCSFSDAVMNNCTFNIIQ